MPNSFARAFEALKSATRRLADAEIEATAELFSQKKIKTKILLTDVQSVSADVVHRAPLVFRK